MVIRKICGSLANKISTRKFGERQKDCVNLRGEEYLYLVEKGIIEDDFQNVFLEESKKKEDFDIRYLVYRDLRNRGYVIKIHDDHYEAKKTYSMNFYPLSDMDHFFAKQIMGRTMPFVMAIVDVDGDITYYLVDMEEPQGESRNLPEEIRGKIVGKRMLIFDHSEKLKNTTFGKYEGLFAHLSLFEAKYLAELGKVKYEGVGDEKYEVYRDLRNRGLIVKSGFKYGTHFRAYEKSMEEHSRYLIHVVGDREEMQRVSRAVRVAHGVRKDLLIAYISSGKVSYFLIKWIKP